MKTKSQILELGYSEDWIIQCKKCKSYDCHKYEDCILCFDCKHKEYKLT